MIVKSERTGRTYDDDNVVFYKNALQSAFYCNNGATLLDLITTNENRFIFVFSISDHKKYIGMWNATNPNKTCGDKS